MFLCTNLILCKGIRGKKVFSQNDEDGAIEDVFKHIGTTDKVKLQIKDMISTNGAIDKVYVEFGVENCVQCNSRYLRFVKKFHCYALLFNLYKSNSLLPESCP